MMMPRWSTAFTQYSGTCLLQSLMGHKYLALLERWPEYTGPLHSSHVKLWCVWPYYTSSLEKRACSGNTQLVIFNAIIEAKVVCRSSTLLSKQLSRRRSVLGKEKKDYGLNKKAHHWELQMMFCWCMSSTSASSKCYSFALKWTAV